MNLGERLVQASKKATQILGDSGARERAKAGYMRVNPLALAESAGVAVLATPMEQLLGAFMREHRPGILLNSERPIGMVHMTCAHELGHFHLGHTTSSDEHLAYGSKADVIEQEANAFAYSLMAPRWLVLTAMLNKGWQVSDLQSADVVYQLSLRMGISFAGMVWGLHRLKLITMAGAMAMSKTQPKALKTKVLPAGMDTPGLSDVWLLDERDKDLVIEPRGTDRFIVSLPSRASAGYLWSAEELIGEGFILKPVTVDSRTQPKRKGPIRVGGEVVSRYVLENDFEDPVQQGRTSAKLRETQPWDQEAAPLSQVGLLMEFERLELGLSAGTRASELAKNLERGA